ncbi:ABC transporter substrate-binding protein [Acidithiobacillus ferrooxidans]|uniref:ABC transporter substrate-binding protein n=1 Tax=Acidithiobacillus ferrooxidans TaxID=920 RepID=UPI001C0754E7|nr:ABC transporter substrate-binding protein [Acidithiobacillus ferrooxidans]MBU2774823.1 ABC transporter substrate-binding protein [Acidithiobacillus ferrooxidans]
MLKSKLVRIMVSAISFMVGGVGAAHADETVSLYLKWVPQYQFAGYLIAKSKGYYEKHGLDVKIISGGPNINTVQEVADGAAQFGIQTPEPIFYAYEHGLHLVMLMADFQRPYEEFMVKKSSPIKTIQNWEGKKIGINIGGLSQLLLPVMLKNAGVNPSSVVTVRKTLSLAPFLSGEVPIWNGYVGNEPFESADQGVPVREFKLAKYLPNWYADTLFAKKEYVVTHAALVKHFVQASQEGWEFAVHHPKQTIAIIKTFNPQKTNKQLAQEASAVIPLMTSKEAPVSCFGKMSDARILSMEKQMKEISSWPEAKGVPAPEYFYDAQFIKCQ